MEQLKEKSKEYEEILGIETVIEKDEAFWESVNYERSRFFKLMGITKWQ